MWNIKKISLRQEERFPGIDLRIFSLSFNPDWGSRNPGRLTGGQWSFYFELLNLCVLFKQGWIEIGFWKWELYIYKDYNSGSCVWIKVLSKSKTYIFFALITLHLFINISKDTKIILYFKKIKKMYYLENKNIGMIKNIIFIAAIGACFLLLMRGCSSDENFRKERKDLNKNVEMLEKRYDSLENVTNKLIVEYGKFEMDFVKDSIMIDSLGSEIETQKKIATCIYWKLLEE